MPFFYLPSGPVCDRSEPGLVRVRDHRLSAGVWSALLSSQPACAALTHPAAFLQPHNPLGAQNQVRTSRLFSTVHFICVVTFFAYIEDDLTGLEDNIVCTFLESIYFS